MLIAYRAAQQVHWYHPMQIAYNQYPVVFSTIVHSNNKHFGAQRLL